MNILFTASEVDPFAKVGGLADVVGSLPSALRDIDIDARVIMPGYGFIDHEKYNISHLFTFQFAHHEGMSDVHIYTTIHDGVPIYFVQTYPYFGNDTEVYTNWHWDSPRFVFFNQVVLATAWELRVRLNWFPDVFHVNDWHTALIPFLIATNRYKREWSTVASVLTIHNLAYQGSDLGGWMWKAGIPPRYHPDLIYQDLTDNLLAIGIAYADIVTTVSPRYAIEIQYPNMGYGLDSMIRSRVSDLYGILNGINVDKWNPETDPKIVSKFTTENFTDKRPANKRHLQESLGLTVDNRIPIIGIVSRLVWQKGFEMAVPALRWLLTEADVQLVILGTGEQAVEQQLGQIGLDYGDKARALLQYDATVAQQIYAGCDIFLMPSKFEPCGIGQMLAMRYGALPLVRETGGLADTVDNYDNSNGERGTGFVFSWETPQAILGTLRWAVETYERRPQAWTHMQRNAMNKDFSWNKSARRYQDLYKRITYKHAQGG